MGQSTWECEQCSLARRSLCTQDVTRQQHPQSTWTTPELSHPTLVLSLLSQPPPAFQGQIFPSSGTLDVMRSHPVPPRYIYFPFLLFSDTSSFSSNLGAATLVLLKSNVNFLPLEMDLQCLLGPVSRSLNSLWTYSASCTRKPVQLPIIPILLASRCQED